MAIWGLLCPTVTKHFHFLSIYIYTLLACQSNRGLYVFSNSHKLDRNWSVTNKLWLLNYFLKILLYSCLEGQGWLSRDFESHPFSLNSERVPGNLPYVQFIAAVTFQVSLWSYGASVSLSLHMQKGSPVLQSMVCQLNWGIKAETRRMSLVRVFLPVRCWRRWSVYSPWEAGKRQRRGNHVVIIRQVYSVILGRLKNPL